MKLRKLTLHNVRRFANRTAVLGPFGDGLTTITAENESGKSTFFGALHALFFYDYGSARKELRDMQPYSGGAMRISAEVSLDGTAYLIEKLFNLKKVGSAATITALETGTIIKQADDAEHWIQQNILTVNNGPFGLLWVRQGTVGVDTSADGVETRRDVMSSVRGQIDAVTGGRRMDTIVQRCKQELDAISTKQDNPKAGSPWKEAVDRVEQLHQEQADLGALVTKLGQDLSNKKRITMRLRELQATELRELRAKEIAQATKKLAAMDAHEGKVQAAQKDLQLLDNTLQDIARQIETITTLQDRRTAIAVEIVEKQTAVAKAEAAKTAAQKAITQQQAKIAEHDQTRRELGQALTLIRQEERQAAKRKRRTVLRDALAQLEGPQKQLLAAEKILGADDITKPALDRMSDLERRRDIAISARDVHFSHFTVHAMSAAATIDGQDLPNDTPKLIDQPLKLTLPGFGTMSLAPAQSTGVTIDNPAELQSALAADLEAAGFKTLTQARTAFDTRQTAQQDHQTAKTQIRALAPDGIDALRREFDGLNAELGASDDDTLGPDDGSASESKEREIAALDKALGDLRDTLPDLQNTLTLATNDLTELTVLLTRLRSDADALTAKKDEPQELDALQTAQTAKTAKRAQAQATLDTLQQDAADLSVAKATHARAVQADEEDKKEIGLLERELARLDGAIQTQSDGAIEERLAEVTGKLERAEDRAAQFANHVKSIRLLIQHLEAARADAQETYFEPVRNELLPLLRQLHAGADFQIDADKLLIETITRNGVTDKVDVLSGGAYEQIAILTRLAFAKLFAKHGNHVPIILDDALIHTDDARISTMFNMLAQTAQDQQIIVLSCRTRAFSDLGGERAYITDIDTTDLEGQTP